MMTYGMIATWRMAYSGVKNQYDALLDGAYAGDVLEQSINEVENFANFVSVGLGGLPNKKGIVQLDAAFMDGDRLAIGAVAGMEQVANPISVARQLSKERFNCFLVGKGADDYALSHGFEASDLLSEKAEERYKDRSEKVATGELSPYDGHDTIGTVVVDQNGSICAGTSSSGLFMKEPGRIGDSPLPGSGFYADSDVGAATATGLGEDLMKGILSYDIVCQMERGLSPMEAAKQSFTTFEKKLERKYGKVGAMSVICMNRAGEWGIATNCEFTFVVATDEQEPTIYIADRTDDGELSIEAMSDEAVADFLTKIETEAE